MLSRAPASAQGVIVWNGPLTTFTEAAGADGSQAADQDRLTADVWITRNLTHGLLNAASETAYTHWFSPANTEWAYGSLANYASLTYTNWEGWFGGLNSGGPRSTIGNPAVMHLISDNIYLSVTFLSWGASAGGFSYERSTPSVPEPGVPLLTLHAIAIALAFQQRWRKPGRGH